MKAIKSIARLMVYHDADADQSDVDTLAATVAQLAPGEFDVQPITSFDVESRNEDDVIVCCGKGAASFFIPSVKITEEAGHVRAVQVEGSKGVHSFPVLLQLAPGYVRRQTEMKGGSSEKIIRLWLDVWEQAANLCTGGKAEYPDTGIINTEIEALSLLRRLSAPGYNNISYDYETWGDVDARRPELNKEFRIISIGLSWYERGVKKAAAFLFDRPQMASAKLEQAWKDFLRAKEGLLTAHFIRYEHKCNIKRFGFTVKGHDTLLKLHALDEVADGALDRVMLRCGLNWGSFKIQYDAERTDARNSPKDKVLRYNGLDALATLECAEHLDEELNREGLEAIAAQSEEFSYYLAFQEMIGFKIDPVQMVKMREKVQREATALLAEFRALPEVKRTEQWAQLNIKSCKKGAVFNPKSPPMMKNFIKEQLRLPPPTKKVKGQLRETYDSKALEGLLEKYPKHGVLRKLNDYRSRAAMAVFLSKWGAYIGPTGCVHTSYNQTIVVTGRLSSTNPPMQNVPKDDEVRTVFVSRFKDGWLINADYKQQEPRLQAGWSGDRKMIQAIMSGLDLHTFVASEIYHIPYESITKESKERDVGKKMNLGISYGQTEYGLSAKTGMSIDEARRMLSQYDERFKDMTAWRIGFHKQAMMFGYVEDLFGARRHLPNAQSSEKHIRERALRQAGNFPIQATAFRFTQIAVAVLMERLWEEVGDRAVVVGQVHDSIIVDSAPEVREKVIALVREAMLIHNEMPWWKDKAVPMAVDIKVGRNLYDMQEVKEAA